MKGAIPFLLLLVLATFSPLVPSPGAQSSLPKKDECLINGTVVKLGSGEPLKNARIRLQSQDDHNESHSVTSDAAGRFELKGIPPGRYRLVVKRDGFISQAYGQRKPDDPGTILALRPGTTMKDLLFRMIPWAVISGRVINDDGDPLPWVQVHAMRESYFGGKRSLFTDTTVPTNDRGEYRLFGLRPGRYLIQADYRPDEQMTGNGEIQMRDDAESTGYVPTYFPAGSDPVRASSLTVTAGEEIPGIEILMRRVEVFSIRGRIMLVGARRSSGGFTASLLPRDNFYALPSRDAIIDDKTGTFVIHDVIPGSYGLTAHTSEDGKKFQAYQNIDLGNADLDGVNLALQSGTTLSGRIIWEGAPQLEGNRLMIFLHAPAMVTRAAVSPGWTFLLPEVYDVPYNPNLYGLGKDCYVKAIRYSSSVSPDDPITPVRGSNATLDITVSSRGARAQGTVASSEGLPAAGVYVVLVPDAAHRTAHRLYKSGVTDQLGRFDIHGIPPGDYKLFSWEDVESGAWEDPEFLKSFEEKGQSISLDEAELKSVALTLIASKNAQPEVR